MSDDRLRRIGGQVRRGIDRDELALAMDALHSAAEQLNSNPQAPSANGTFLVEHGTCCHSR
jgi:hypothetical protein